MVGFKLFICGLLFIAACAAPADEECDKTKCKGPLKFYEELSCEPVYKNKGDCCPYKFNCENLNNRSTDKCYFKGREYGLGEQLREQDANPCDINCSCRQNLGVAGFTCAIIDCPQHVASPGCYLPQSTKDCCPGPEICPEREKDWPTCKVDGKIYKAGDYFSPDAEPEKDCHCGAGYKGENVEPFCKTRGLSCGVELRHAYEIHHNCPPVFYNSQSPQKDCAVAFRCQNSKDEVINADGTPGTVDAKSASGEQDTCKFGNIIMKLGQKLNQKTDYDSVCVECICEVPPIPTCQQLPDDVCDITVHPKFD